VRQPSAVPGRGISGGCCRQPQAVVQTLTAGCFLHEEKGDVQSNVITLKSFNFMGTKFRDLTTMDMFVDTSPCGFQIIPNIIEVNKYIIEILIHGLSYLRN